MVQLLLCCRCVTSGKALRWPITYMEANIPGRLLCNMNSVFLQFTLRSSQHKDKTVGAKIALQCCKILSVSIINCSVLASDKSLKGIELLLQLHFPLHCCNAGLFCSLDLHILTYLDYFFTLLTL